MATPLSYELIGYAASALIVLSLLMASVLRLRIINLVGAVVFAIYGVLIDSPPIVLTNGAIVLIDIYYLRLLLRDRAADAYFEVLEVPVTSPILRRFVEFHLDDLRGFQPSFSGLRDDHLAWLVLRDAVPVGVVVGSPAAGGPGPDGAADPAASAEAPTEGARSAPGDVATAGNGDSSPVPAPHGTGASAEAPTADNGDSSPVPAPHGTDASAEAPTAGNGDSSPVPAPHGTDASAEAPTAAGARDVLRIEADYVTPAHRDLTAGTVLFGGSRAFEMAGFRRLVTTTGSTTHRRYLERMGFEREGDDVWTRDVA